MCFLVDFLLPGLGQNFKKLRINFVLNPVVFPSAVTLEWYYRERKMSIYFVVTIFS
jgi:hypothetical protein